MFDEFKLSEFARPSAVSPLSSCVRDTLIVHENRDFFKMVLKCGIAHTSYPIERNN